VHDAVFKYNPDLRSLADIRLVVQEDGPGRGQRLLIARNAAGLAFEVALDRGFDITELMFRGTNLGWHSPNQRPFPTFHPDAEGGWAFLRNMDGFLVTCGLDHFGGPATIDSSHYINPHRSETSLPQHGRISTARAKLEGYAVDAQRDLVWCEGTVRQAILFGGVLELRRRITVPIFGDTITLVDTVSNLGFRPTPHALLYHFNIGYPLLDEKLSLVGFPADFRAEFAKTSVVPRDDAVETVDRVAITPDENGTVRAGVVNRQILGEPELEFSYLQSELPELIVWRCYQSGIFALGIEPATKASSEDGRPVAMQLLAAREQRRYEIRIRAHSSAVI
jgi:hypothetical protein